MGPGRLVNRYGSAKQVHILRPVPVLELFLFRSRHLVTDHQTHIGQFPYEALKRQVILCQLGQSYREGTFGIDRNERLEAVLKNRHHTPVREGLP